MAINWRGAQAYGCKQPDFKAPGETNISHMAGGSWHANLMKDGTKYLRSSGGSSKPKKKGSRKVHVLPHGLNIDKHGYVWH